MTCQQQYSRVSASVASVTHRDDWTKTELLSEYGERKRNRVKQVLNVVSKAVVKGAKERRARIVLEKLTHMRRVHRKGNGEGKRLRRRLNVWPFRFLQSQIEYKAKWESVP